MTSRRKIAFALMLSGALSSILFAVPGLLPGVDPKIGVRQGSLLVGAMTAAVLGTYAALFVRDRSDAADLRRHRRAGLLLLLIGPFLLVTTFAAAGWPGVAENRWVQLLRLFAASILVSGLLLLAAAKAWQIPWDGWESLSGRVKWREWIQRARLAKFPRDWLAPTVALVVLVEFALFRTSFLMNIAPYYPIGFDQLATYNWIYAAYFAVRDHGVLALFRGNVGISSYFFKGVMVPVLGLVSAFLFGPNRMAIAYVNFIFLILGQAGLWVSLRRWSGMAAALIGEGLFLFSDAFWPFYSGSMHDMRFDFAGMITFGIAFISLALLVERPSPKRLWLSLLCILVTLLTRSISIVYVVGTLGLLVGYFALRQWVRRDAAYRLRFMLLLAAGTAIEVLLFAAFQWKNFDAYYVNLLRSGEGPIRDAEFAVSSFGGRPLYFLDSARMHFAGYFPILLLAFAGLLLGLARRFIPGREVVPGARFAHFAGTVLALFPVTAIATFTALSIYSPSPVVIGVLTVPFVFALTILLVEAFGWLDISVFRIFSVLIFFLGLGNYFTAMAAPVLMPYGSRQDARMVNQIYTDLASEAQGRSAIYWMLIDPALNEGAFYTYWAEHYAEPAPFQAHVFTIFTLSTADFMAVIDSSDIVVAPLEPMTTTGFEFPYAASVRELQGVWRPYLEKDFGLTKTYKVNGLAIGIYVRRVEILEIRNLNGLEQRHGRPFFWIGQGTTQIFIQSLEAGRVMLSAQLVRGQSLPDNDVRHLRVSTAIESFDLAIPATQRELTFTLRVSEGLNEIRLIPLDVPSPSQLANGDQAPPLSGILNLHIAGFTGAP